MSGDARVVNRLASGTTLGPYQIERLLGAGGMGDVYRARDTRLGRTVALKILPIHLRSEPQLLGRFEREARAIAGLDDPYICTLHDVGRHEDIDFLVMELIEGETLAERLRNGPLPIDEAVRHGTRDAEALAAAHDKGIIHRDIKPSNIFVTKGGHVKVIDFGLAKESSLFHSSESTQEDRTQPGVTIGTLLYMSPEQALGQPLDPRTDLFSLGVVLFECLTGELPFVGQSRIEYLPNLLAGRSVGGRASARRPSAAAGDPRPLPRARPREKARFGVLARGGARPDRTRAQGFGAVEVGVQGCLGGGHRLAGDRLLAAPGRWGRDNGPPAPAFHDVTR